MTSPINPLLNPQASNASVNAAQNAQGNNPAAPGVGNTDKVTPFQELGTTGLKRMRGQVYEEFLPQLRYEKANKVFYEMWMNDPIVSALWFAIDQYLRKVEWRVDPASQATDDMENAQFLRECMDDMSHTWAELVSETNTRLIFGWAYNEIVYKRRQGQEPGTDPDTGKELPRSRYEDGKIGWRKIPLRGQDSFVDWEFDEEGGVQGMWQRSYPDFVLRFVPIEKALLFRTGGHKNNPQGRSILRGAYRPWFFKKRTEENEGIGIERDLAGLPMASIPAEMIQSENAEDMATVQMFKQLVMNVRNDEQTGIVWPLAYDDKGNQLYKFELLSSGGARAIDTNAVIERYDKRIAMVVLADFILLGSENVGSYALSVSKTGMFQAALSAMLDDVAEVLNRHAVPRLMKLNGVKLDSLPIINHEEVQEPTLEELGTFISNMVGSGWADILADPKIRTSLLKRAQLPLSEDETEGDTSVDIDMNDQVSGGTAGKPVETQFLTRAGIAEIGADGKPVPTAAPVVPTTPTAKPVNIPVKKSDD